MWEFSQVRDEKKTANNMNYEQWVFAMKITSGVSPIDKIMTPSWFINFIWKCFVFPK